MSAVYLLRYEGMRKTFMSVSQAVGKTRGGGATSGRILETPAIGFESKAEALWFWRHHRFYITGHAKCGVYEIPSEGTHLYRLLSEAQPWVLG